MATDARVHAHLAHEVDRVNQRFARVEQIKRFAILDRDLTQETGELTPTQKAEASGRLLQLQTCHRLPLPMSSWSSARRSSLRDGSHVRIRQGHHTDRDLLLRGFERLSPESRYRRFLAPIAELSEATVRYLTEIDHHDHEAMIALDEQTGEGIGVARYVRDPDHPDVAEVAVTVIDDWQRRGVGTLLLDVISARAREEGITTLHRTHARHQQGDDGPAPRA